MLLPSFLVVCPPEGVGGLISSSKCPSKLAGLTFHMDVATVRLTLDAWPLVVVAILTRPTLGAPKTRPFPGGDGETQWSQVRSTQSMTDQVCGANQRQEPCGLSNAGAGDDHPQPVTIPVCALREPKD
jgi:hypothetical protein